MSTRNAGYFLNALQGEYGSDVMTQKPEKIPKQSEEWILGLLFLKNPAGPPGGQRRLILIRRLTRWQRQGQSHGTQFSYTEI